MNPGNCRRSWPAKFSVEIGKDYPLPVVDPQLARERAVAVCAAVMGKK